MLYFKACTLVGWWCISRHLGIIQTWVSYSFEVQSACYVSLQEEGEILVLRHSDMQFIADVLEVARSSSFLYLFRCWFNWCSVLHVQSLEGFYVLCMQIHFDTLYRCSYSSSRSLYLHVFSAVLLPLLEKSGCADAFTVERWMETEAALAATVRGGNGCSWVYITITSSHILFPSHPYTI